MKNGKIFKHVGIFFVILLFLTGIVHWLVFFNYGELSFGAYDWPKELKCFTVIKEALTENIIPYHVSEALPYDATNRFLALPEICLSPQILLLKVMSLNKFIVFNTIFMYMIGFLGCLLIRNKYKLSSLPFAVLFLLFNFNGYITSHIAAGHSMWNGYFLLPFFCLFIFEMIEGAKGSNSIIKMSVLLFLILLQGAWHMFVWCLLFLVLMAIFNKNYRKQVLYIALLSMALSFFRILPTVITFYNKGYRFMTGYPTLRDLFDALTVIRDHTYTYLGGILANLYSWEYDAFIDIIGLAIIAYFGIYLRFGKNADIKAHKYKELDMPMLLMTLFTLSSFYAFIAILPIPFFNAIRVPTRMIIIPLLMLVFISCIRMQCVIGRLKQNRAIKILSILAVMQMAFALLGHSKTWRISVLEEKFRDTIVSITTHSITISEPFYESCVNISALISLIAFLSLVAFIVYKQLAGDNSRA